MGSTQGARCCGRPPARVISSFSSLSAPPAEFAPTVCYPAGAFFDWGNASTAGGTRAAVSGSACASVYACATRAGSVIAAAGWPHRTYNLDFVPSGATGLFTRPSVAASPGCGMYPMPVRRSRLLLRGSSLSAPISRSSASK